ncbi:AAA family ATPase, partial [Magnetovibrio sp. PR-2]|uniref:ATP-dependent nuclease n=1 Tax=Magnetovibrio sp. PR-2 TaxID=3120356 RepID=UPI002FCE4921
LPFQNEGSSTGLNQQGTGIRRAIFWGLVHVHNQLELQEKLRDDTKKKLEKTLKAEQKKAKQDEAKIEALKAELQAMGDGADIEVDPDDVALPGNILLIDEPENALHPQAVRAAQKQLYKLAEDADWQVLLTTHSPYFVNPLEDHTTIIRLENTAVDGRVNSLSYVADNSSFEEAGVLNGLKALLQLDVSVSEMFFGSFPILVEGDTEHAAFLSSIIEENKELAKRAIVVKARGKALLTPLAQILRHFKVPYGIMHDADTPYNKNGGNSGTWTENKKIREEIETARSEGLVVNHHVSFPDFEHWLDIEPVAKEKPMNAYTTISGNQPYITKLSELFNALASDNNHDPLSIEDFNRHAGGYMDALISESVGKAEELGMADLPCYSGIAPAPE